MSSPTPISAQQLKSWLDAGEVTLVDVREPAEFAAGHIPGAISQPLSGIRSAVLPPLHGKKLVMQCKLGRRGESACGIILSENPSLTVFNLEGGIDSWVAAGYGLEGSGRTILPLDRQAQLVVGTILLLSSITGFALTIPELFLLTGLFGIGLILAGLTGFCGLLVLLARMPWNRRRS